MPRRLETARRCEEDLDVDMSDDTDDSLLDSCSMPPNTLLLQTTEAIPTAG